MRSDPFIIAYQWKTDLLFISLRMPWIMMVYSVKSLLFLNFQILNKWWISNVIGPCLASRLPRFYHRINIHHKIHKKFFWTIFHMKIAKNLFRINFHHKIPKEYFWTLFHLKIAKSLFWKSLHYRIPKESFWTIFHLKIAKN